MTPKVSRGGYNPYLWRNAQKHAWTRWETPCATLALRGRWEHLWPPPAVLHPPPPDLHLQSHHQQSPMCSSLSQPSEIKQSCWSCCSAQEVKSRGLNLGSDLLNWCGPTRWASPGWGVEKEAGEDSMYSSATVRGQRCAGLWTKKVFCT